MSNVETTCPVCGSTVPHPLFNGEILNKYNISYYKCSNCRFVFTEEPYWFDEAHSAPIADLDIGLINRNIILASKTRDLINRHFDPGKKFLDYAGGYGMFVRIMRDEGYDFFRQDKYCENLFAKYFDILDLNNSIDLNKYFEMMTAFEVLEHLKDPVDEIEKMFYYSDSILMTTEMYKDEYLVNNTDWWYFSPLTGQHVSFYSAKTFEYISHKLSCNYYSHDNIHLLTFKKFVSNPLIQIDKSENILFHLTRKVCNRIVQLMDGKQNNKIIMKGKLSDDYDYIKKKKSSLK